MTPLGSGYIDHTRTWKGGETSLLDSMKSFAFARDRRIQGSISLFRIA